MSLSGKNVKIFKDNLSGCDLSQRFAEKKLLLKRVLKSRKLKGIAEKRIVVPAGKSGCVSNPLSENEDIENEEIGKDEVDNEQIEYAEINTKENDRRIWLQ
ncbi:hypothetical protein HHI36_014685 [Cryptolaemus montrouzieri]|uniref:Uncharacterized protein n=1 Tax=Cryptolaemus montrouzieri TaxID=559131 RepID=A0ABD2N3A7_9CUCU